jgi:small GTP-binding protein
MEEILFRILIVGDSGVGKSCILLRFTQGIFSTSVDLTIGVDFATKTIQLFNKQVKLQVWDTAGQEGFRSITRSFYRNADGIFLVFNVNNRKTFDNCESWINEIRNNSPPEVLIYLLGNQCDLPGAKEVTPDDAKSFVNSRNLNGYIETSAKEGLGINDAFHDFCSQIYKKAGGRLSDPPKSIKPSVERMQLSHHSPKKKKKCC